MPKTRPTDYMPKRTPPSSSEHVDVCAVPEHDFVVGREKLSGESCHRLNIADVAQEQLSHTSSAWRKPRAAPQCCSVAMRACRQQQFPAQTRASRKRKHSNTSHLATVKRARQEACHAKACHLAKDSDTAVCKQTNCGQASTNGRHQTPNRSSLNGSKHELQMQLQPRPLPTGHPPTTSGVLHGPAPDEPVQIERRPQHRSAAACANRHQVNGCQHHCIQAERRWVEVAVQPPASSSENSSRLADLHSMRTNALPLQQDHIIQHLPVMCPPMLQDLRQQHSRLISKGSNTPLPTAKAQSWQAANDSSKIQIRELVPSGLAKTVAAEITRRAEYVDIPVQAACAEECCPQYQDLQCMREQAAPLLDSSEDQPQAPSCVSALQQLRRDALGAACQDAALKGTRCAFAGIAVCH